MKDEKYTLLEVSQMTGLDPSRINAWITMEWVSPLAAGALDEEDIARLRLIHELQQDLGANEEAVPLILHLLDQLCYIQDVLRKVNGKTS